MDQSNSPPVPHMLRPHHVGILLFLIVYYRGLDWGEKGQPPRPLHKKVKQRMLVVLAREIGEVSVRATILVLSYSELGVVVQCRYLERWNLQHHMNNWRPKWTRRRMI